jgi:hypothetical protein
MFFPVCAEKQTDRFTANVLPIISEADNPRSGLLR